MKTAKLSLLLGAALALLCAPAGADIVWDFTGGNTNGWGFMDSNKVADQAFSPFAIGDGGEDDETETGHFEFFVTHTSSYNAIGADGKGLHTDYSTFVGVKTAAGALADYKDGTLTFNYSEHLTGAWQDPSRIPNSASSGFAYLDGYVNGEYVLLRIDIPYDFASEEDLSTAITLSASSLQRVSRNYEYDMMGDTISTEMLASLTDEEFEAFLAGEVGVYFRLASNEAVYVGAGDPESVTFLQSVTVAPHQIPEPAAAALLFGALAFFAARRRRA